MHSKPGARKGATYPVTIQTPYGVLRMGYEVNLTPCAECGQFHAAVVMLDASPRLKTQEAEDFLVELLPVVLSALGDLAFLHCATSSTSAVSAVVG